MPHEFLIPLSLGLVVVILASILGAVERQERYLFVAGIAIFIAVHVVGPAARTIATIIAVIGIFLAAISTVPLLRQSV